MKTQITFSRRTTLPLFMTTMLKRILLFALLMMVVSVVQAQVYYSRTTGNWNSSGTWSTLTCGSPINTGSFPVAGDTVYVCSGHTVTVNAHSACALLHITGTLLNKGNNITVSGTTTISGTMNDDNSSGINSFNDILISSGGTFNNTGNAAFSISGNFTNNGSFSPGTGTFTFTGASKTISGANAIVLANTTINGSYTNNGTLTVNTALAGTGTLTQGVKSALNVGGTFTTANFDASADSNTVIYTSTTANQAVLSTTYHNLGINKSSRIASLAGAITVNGNLTVSAGTLDDTGYQITGNSTGTLTMDSSTKLTIGTAASGTSFPTNYSSGNVSMGPSTEVVYNSNQAQTIAALTYGKLTLTAGSAVTKTAAGNMTIGSQLNIGSNNTFADAGFAIEAAGDVVNNGTISGTGKLALTGTNVTNTIGGGTSNYGNVELDNTNGYTWTGTGTTTVDGNLIITQGTMTKGAFTTAFVVSGNTIISGTLNTTSTTGTNTFNNITVNNGGTWNVTVAEPFTINGNIQNDGTFSSGTGVYTLAGSGKTLSGANAVTINSATITGSYTNNGTFTVSTAFAGAGSLTQGTNATINIGGTNTLSTMDIASNPNTVCFNSTAAAQTVPGLTYYNLAIDKSSQTATLGGAVTINGDLRITSGTLADGGFQISGNANGNLILSSGSTLTLGTTATATAFPLNFVAGNISLDAASTVNYNSNQAQSIRSDMEYGNLTLTATAAVTKTISSDMTLKGSLTIGANNTLSDGGYTITVKGDVTNNRIHSGGGKILLSGGSGAHTITSAAATFGNLELDDANGASWTGTGTTTVAGNLTVKNGTLSTGAFSTGLVVTGETDIYSTFTITSTTGTRTFDNITVYSGGVWDATVNEPVTVNGNIRNNGTFNSNTGVYTLAGSGKTLSGSSGVTIASATITGSYTNTGTFTVGTALAGGGSLTQGLNTLLYVGGTFTTTTLDAATNPNTVIYNGTGGAQTTNATTYHHLTIDKSSQTATLGGTTTVNGTLTVASGTLATSTQIFTANGPVNIDGTFTTGSSGVKTFSGLITVNSGATWTSTAMTDATRIFFQGGITNNGTFNAGTATFNATQTLAGSSTMAFSTKPLITGAITVTHNNFHITVPELDMSNGAVLISNGDFSSLSKLS
jgi:hypothetical protein